MGNSLVLGVGNLLLSDEGIGIHAIRKLVDSQVLPEDIEIVDGGTAGLNLLTYLEGVDRLVIIDAVETGGPPGTLVRIAGDRVPAYLALKISPHEITLPDFLAASKLRDLYPNEVIIWGMQPGSLEVGIDLSADVEEKLSALVDHVIEEFA